MKIEIVKIKEVKNNPNNPRIIKDDNFKKLVKSIKEFPEMLKLRPIVVNEEMEVLGGNMRLKASKEAGLKEVPIIKASELTPEQQKEFIIKDNVSFGDWDYDTLANEWSDTSLNEWGLNVWENLDEKYEPVLVPETKYSDITREEIEKEARKLADQIIKGQTLVDVICSKCGHEFKIEKNG